MSSLHPVSDAFCTRPPQRNYWSKVSTSYFFGALRSKSNAPTLRSNFLGRSISFVRTSLDNNLALITISSAVSETKTGHESMEVNFSTVKHASLMVGFSPLQCNRILLRMPHLLKFIQYH